MTTTWKAWPPSCQTIVDIQELMCLCVYSGNEDSVFKFVMRWWESWMRGWILITGKQAHHQYNHKNTVHCSHMQRTIATSYIDRSCGTFVTLAGLYTCIETAILIKVAFEFKPGSTQFIFACHHIHNVDAIHSFATINLGAHILMIQLLNLVDGHTQTSILWPRLRHKLTWP